MAIITLTEAKNHLRVSASTEDSTIQIYVDAAEEYIKRFLNRDIVPRNSAIKAAALLTVGDLYDNREGAGEKSISENPAVMRLLYPYRIEIGI